VIGSDLSLAHAPSQPSCGSNAKTASLFLLRNK
jgi:hypothetical protein